MESYERAILRILAGYHPLSGLPLPQDSAWRSPEVERDLRIMFERSLPTSPKGTPLSKDYDRHDPSGSCCVFPF